MENKILNLQYNTTTRRATLLGLATTLSIGRASLALAAPPTQNRLVVILLRGAMDGLSVVIPHGDPDLTALRASLIPKPIGDPGGMNDLGGFYALHPALAEMHAMFTQGELLIAHAIAGNYRTRSHFDGQDYLESGAERRLDSGWLNRAIAAMPGHRATGEALAIGIGLPLLLRGPAPAANWAPSGFATPSADLYTRIAELHHADPLTGPAIMLFKFPNC